ncbi:SRPBCC domain-containing protein [Streptomyces prasinopilosus]|uniref:Carbon monoxide dehydrogenase subunit G n=1 Tax=Streptomyces prasinopilosus TaxID=67344 RepID=A0A1G6VMK8_9ACTN|nr:SRPBCC domain-containing protein [Streptomyces prasinopilosus]SDD54267.1 Carbon monoxide dehydrogenase subunit G [Streptomyces prasinopilosus]
MEHEVFVPVPVERLREALDDPARVARAVPGLQHDAGADPVAGRLKVRIGGHSITYRGAVRVTRRDDGSYAVEGDAAETRGTGTVELALRLSPRDAEGGATLAVHGTATADGRVTELPPDAVASAVARLLNRFAANLGTTTGATAETAAGADSGEEAPGRTASGEGASGEGASGGGAPGEGASGGGASSSDSPSASEPSAGEPSDPETPPVPPDPSALDAEIPLPSLDPGPPDDVAGIGDGPADGEDDADEGAVAEAAHARRTMIGRSAEEVDHAPPRGRYAPVPAPQTVSASPSLRWAAPAAALAVASAIVAVRALRKRG